MAQQTAVDFYIDKMNQFFEDSAIHCELSKNDKIYLQAKQMEKEQIIKAYNAYYSQETFIDGEYFKGEQYYNETYMTNKNNNDK